MYTMQFWRYDFMPSSLAEEVIKKSRVSDPIRR